MASADSTSWWRSSPLHCRGHYWGLCVLCCGINQILLEQQHLCFWLEETWKPIKKARSFLGCPLDPVQVVGETMVIAELSSPLVNFYQPSGGHWQLLWWQTEIIVFEERYCMFFLPVSNNVHPLPSVFCCGTVVGVCLALVSFPSTYNFSTAPPKHWITLVLWMMADYFI